MSQSRELEEDRSVIKILILGLVGITLSYFTVYFFNKFLNSVHSSDILLSVIFAFSFSVFTIIQVFLIKSLSKINLIVFLETLAALAVFYPRFYPQTSWILLGAGFILFLFLSLGVGQGVKFLENSIKIKYTLTAKLVIPKVVTGLLIFLSVIFYLNYFVWGKFTDQMGQTIINQSLALSKPIFKPLDQNFSPNENLRDFFSHLAENRLRKLKSGDFKTVLPNFEYDYEHLPPEIQKELVARTAEQLKLVSEKTVGPLNWTDSIARTVFNLVKRNTRGLSQNFNSVYGIALAVMFFVAMKGVAVLFYWLIEFFAFVIMKFLLVSGFAYLSIENRSREFILLK